MKNLKKFNEIYYYDGRGEMSFDTIKGKIEDGSIKVPDRKSKEKILDFLENIDENKFELQKYSAGKKLNFDLFYFNNPKSETLWIIFKHEKPLAAILHNSFTTMGAYIETSPMIVDSDWVSFSLKGSYPGTWDSWIFFPITGKWVDPSVG